GPGAVQTSWLYDLISVLTQTFVDLIDPLFALLDEANMKACWILHLSSFCRREERQNHAVVVGEKTHGFIRFSCSVAFQTEVLFQEAIRFQDIGDGQVQVVKLHTWSSASVNRVGSPYDSRYSAAVAVPGPTARGGTSTIDLAGLRVLTFSAPSLGR